MEDRMKELATKFTNHAKITTYTYKRSEIELVGGSGTVYTCGGCGYHVAHQYRSIPAVAVFAFDSARSALCPACTSSFIAYLAQDAVNEALDAVGRAKALGAEQERRKTDETT